MTATYTAEAIREAALEVAPDATTAREAAAWMVDILNDYGSAHFARVARVGARRPTDSANAFAYTVRATYQSLVFRDSPVERNFLSDDLARTVRRRLIQAGRSVSLLAYDCERDLHGFDVLD